MAGRDEDLGLILRSACDGVAGEAIAAEVAELADLAARLLAEAEGRTPEALLDAPDAAHLAWRDWAAPDPDEVIDRPGAFAAEGVWDLVAAQRGGPVALPGGGTMWLEATRALVAVDVNTGPDTSPAAALKANLAAARELPRQLRLRGLGGQVVVDFAPMPKPDRVPLEQSLRALTRAEGIETALVGWTGLGLFEMQRKRERLPLEQALAGVWPQ
jgi:Ribonuclease G/E